MKQRFNSGDLIYSIEYYTPSYHLVSSDCLDSVNGKPYVILYQIPYFPEDILSCFSNNNYWQYVEKGWFETSRFFYIDSIEQIPDHDKRKSTLQTLVSNLALLTAPSPIRDFVKKYGNLEYPEI